MQTGKQRLEMLLNGQIPDAPPHWELVFQIEKAMWGMDAEGLEGVDLWDYYIDVYRRLIDEFGWAAINAGEDPKGITHYAKALGSDTLIAAFNWCGVFWMPTGENMMDFVVQLFEQPKQLHEQARAKCDNAKQKIRRAVDAGADFFVQAYDFGFNTGPFISPDQFREFVTPYLTELVETIHDLGKKTILHSDGCITQILDQIHGTGIDGYQSVDPQGHMDIRQVRQQYPNWILMGNVACNMLQDGKEDEIKKSVQYCMEHGGVGKPYIFSTSNCIFNGMPVESYQIMFNEYQRIIAGATAG